MARARFTTDRTPFVAVPVWILRHDDLSPTDVLVYAALMAYASDGDPVVWPSLRRIGEDLGKSRDTVRRSIRSLESHGILESEERHVEGRQTSTLYRLTWNPPGVADTPGGVADTRDPGTADTPPSGVADTRDQELDPEDLDPEEPTGADESTPQWADPIILDDPDPPARNLHAPARTPHLWRTIGGGRTRDRLFEALREVTAAGSEVLTKSERGRLNRAVAEIREIGGTPGQVVRRAAQWRVLEWPGVPTPNGISSNWSRLRPGFRVDTSKAVTVAPVNPETCQHPAPYFEGPDDPRDDVCRLCGMIRPASFSVFLAPTS